MVSCEVHKIHDDDPLKVIRIRATAFQDKKDKLGRCIRFIVQIKNTQGKLAYFEAEYADDAYMKRWQDKGINFSQNDLIFMSEPCRKPLKVEPPKQGKPPDRVEVEAIQGEELQTLYGVHSALSDDSNEGWLWIKPSPQNAILREEIENKRHIVRIKIKPSPQNAILREEIENKHRIVRIKRKDAKPVFSEALLADVHYLENWKKEKGIEFGDEDNFIFISAWYRHLLGIENIGTPMIIDLDVKPLSRLSLCALLYQYPRNHPQALVLGASMMGIIGFGLGVIGTGLGIVGIEGWLADHILPPYLTNFWTPFGFVVFGVGFAFTLLGILGLIRR